jgi:hypothetical protein
MGRLDRPSEKNGQANRPAHSLSRVAAVMRRYEKAIRIRRCRSTEVAPYRQSPRVGVHSLRGAAHQQHKWEWLLAGCIALASCSESSLQDASTPELTSTHWHISNYAQQCSYVVSPCDDGAIVYNSNTHEIYDCHAGNQAVPGSPGESEAYFTCYLWSSKLRLPLNGPVTIASSIPTGSATQIAQTFWIIGATINELGYCGVATIASGGGCLSSPTIVNTLPSLASPERRHP